jgi:hypothetical protein
MVLPGGVWPAGLVGTGDEGAKAAGDEGDPDDEGDADEEGTAESLGRAEAPTDGNGDSAGPPCAPGWDGPALPPPRSGVWDRP